MSPFWILILPTRTKRESVYELNTDNYGWKLYGSEHIRVKITINLYLYARSFFYSFTIRLEFVFVLHCFWLFDNYWSTNFSPDHIIRFVAMIHNIQERKLNDFSHVIYEWEIYRNTPWMRKPFFISHTVNPYNP